MKIPEKLRIWIVARRNLHLSHAQIQMARELGLNPEKLGKLANHKPEPWKAPLPRFIEELYFKRFGRNQPDRVISIEDRAKELGRKKTEKRELRQAAACGSPGPGPAATLESGRENENY